MLNESFLLKDIKMKIFLDTNVFIIGYLQSDSPERMILEWVGLYGNSPQAQVIISQELIDQILRVGRRLQGKDWAAKLVAQIWQNLDFLFIIETENMKREERMLLAQQVIPREDVIIYLTAKSGKTDYFISGNRELIRAIADFECLASEDFINKVIKNL